MTGRDDRGVAPVIGFILVFSFLVLAFTIYQGVVVPNQNEAVEFEHNQQVQGSIQDLRNAILSAATGGTERTVSIKLGADYPRRTIAQNLGFSSGSIRTTTVGTGNLTIANATAIDRYGETSDYWTGARRFYETKAVVYRPIYSFYTNAPRTIYANTLVYNHFRNANLTITGQSLINGNRITLVSLVGNLSRSEQGTVSIDPEAISASTTRIAIRNRTHRINITIPTRLNASWWNDTLSEELVSAGGHVADVRNAGDDQVSILLEPGEYTLRMAKIGVGELPTSTSREPATYITMVDKPSRTVFNGTSHSITVEVRDRFNNPVSGKQVNASVFAGSGTFSSENVTTGPLGQATFNYTAPPNSTSVELRFNITAGNPKPYEEAWANLSVKQSGGGNGGGGNGGGGGAGSGSTSNWSESDTNETFTQANGQWQNISKIGRIELSEGTMVTVEECVTGGSGNNFETVCTFVDKLRLTFNVFNDTETYTFDVFLKDINQDGDFVDDDVVCAGQGSSEKCLDDRKTVDQYDADGTRIFRGHLDTPDDILTSAGTNILDAGVYSPIDTGGQSELDRAKLSNASWLTGTMEGRIVVTIESS